jgi:hypothetical protein
VQSLECFTVIRPALEKEIIQAQVATEGENVKNPVPWNGTGERSQPYLTSLSLHYVRQVTIPCDAYSSRMLYRLWLKVLMGRNGAGDTTSRLNLGEEYCTPKGGTRCVRVRLTLSRTTTHALPTTKGKTAAERGQGKSGEDGSFYHSTALWQQWIQTRSLSWRGCWHTTYWHLSHNLATSALWGASPATRRYPGVTCHTQAVSSSKKKSQDALQKGSLSQSEETSRLVSSLGRAQSPSPSENDPLGSSHLAH